ncbi:uncharacterized protein J4E84_009143 [Alternaria hordeiaustralica]|uniref:uncharacterized protein n=1 Tax=Alternaria hordeiaustralica TaxID=1187925 RepID=UPI0020C2CAEB|nr:uncharacterized protein J4E84_009143 [Alternaria hordeiaustralica]KAI4677458.1 hypothetical protein J4E84_009143 [Alternaria hordeiaustralica]
MSATQDSTMNQYAAHTGAVPNAAAVVSVNEPTTRINAQTTITAERPIKATIDSFRENDIIDWFTTTMGTNIAYDVKDANDDIARDTSLMHLGIAAFSYPSNDKKANGDPEKSYDSDRQSKGQAMEEVHESKFD